MILSRMPARAAVAVCFQMSTPTVACKYFTASNFHQHRNGIYYTGDGDRQYYYKQQSKRFKSSEKLLTVTSPTPTASSTTDNNKRKVAVEPAGATHPASSAEIKQSTETNQPHKTLKEAETAAALNQSDLYDDSVEVLPNVDTIHEGPWFNERFIAITKKALVEKLASSEFGLPEEFRKRISNLCTVLEHGVSNHFHDMFSEIEDTYEKIKPTAESSFNPLGEGVLTEEEAKSEQKLVEQMSFLLDKAGFIEIPREKLLTMLDRHDYQHRVKVTVDLNKYQILRIFVMGLYDGTPTMANLSKVSEVIQTIDEPEMLPDTIESVLWGKKKQRKKQDYYRRVCLLIKQKQQKRVMMKLFKHVPTLALDQLLPDVKIRLRKFDHVILSAVIGMGTFGIIGNLLMVVGELQENMHSLLLVCFVAAIIQSIASYSRRKHEYLAHLTTMLYGKSVAANRGVLTILIIRAQNEIVKKLLLTYCCLVRMGGVREFTPTLCDESERGVNVPTANALDKMAREVLTQFKLGDIQFNSTNSLKILEQFGVVRVCADNVSSRLCSIYAMPIDQAMHLLVAKRIDFFLSMESSNRERQLEQHFVYREDTKTVDKRKTTEL